MDCWFPWRRAVASSGDARRGGLNQGRPGNSPDRSGSSPRVFAVAERVDARAAHALVLRVVGGADHSLLLFFDDPGVLHDAVLCGTRATARVWPQPGRESLAGPPAVADRIAN